MLLYKRASQVDGLVNMGSDSIDIPGKQPPVGPGFNVDDVDVAAQFAGSIAEAPVETFSRLRLELLAIIWSESDSEIAERFTF